MSRKNYRKFTITNSSLNVKLKSPYLIFICDIDNSIYAKTGLGMAQWYPEKVAGQLRFSGNTLDLGVLDLSLYEAVKLGVQSLVIGVAPIGESIDNSWVRILAEAVEQGLDIVSGLHLRLEDIPGLATAANTSGAHLVNVRTPPVNLPIGNGLKRSGKRVLMVGTDCAVGKKYTALALTNSLNKLNVEATFRATGQTK